MKGEITDSANKRILFLPHAVQQMARPDRMISPSEVEPAILGGEIIEEYLDDSRGRNCLIMHLSGDRCVHVICTPQSDYLAIITVYLPDVELWEMGLRTGKYLWNVCIARD